MEIIDFETLKQDEPAFMLYFYNDTCSVCHHLWPKVEDLMTSDFPLVKVVRVHADESRELMGQLRMMSIPGILIYLEGKEYMRANGLVSIHEMESRIKRPYDLMFN